ncbi:MAG: phosphonate C-P lyase system protein PhnG, partial [Pseudolabrys sp.]|nr:phosphonate C-P lyase system protein PhnG [Pseudolabrys sp.]
MTPDQTMQAKRQAAMAVLVHADTGELARRV